MNVKVKFNQPHTVVRPGSGKTTYSGTMQLDKDLAERWQKNGYLEILDKEEVEVKVKVEPEFVPKHTYKKKVK